MSSRSLGSWLSGLIVLGLGGCFDHHSVDETSIAQDPSSVGDTNGGGNGDESTGGDDESTGDNGEDPGDDESDAGAPAPEDPCARIPEPLRDIICPPGGGTNGGTNFGFPTNGGVNGGNTRGTNGGVNGGNTRGTNGGTSGGSTRGTNGGTTGGTSGNNPIAEIFGIDCDELKPGDIFGQFICSLGGIFGGNSGTGTSGGSSGGSTGRNNR